MDIQELEIYLSNIYLIALVDGPLCEAEEFAINKILIEKSIDKSTQLKCIKNASQNSNVKPIGNFSDRIKNLEDMFVITFSNGKINKSERDIIIQFINEIDLTKEQIHKIAHDANRIAKSLFTITNCPNCSSNIVIGYQYCPKCGAHLVQSGINKQRNQCIDMISTEDSTITSLLETIAALKKKLEAKTKVASQKNLYNPQTLVLDTLNLNLVEKETILYVLQLKNWIQKDAAKILGISPRTLNYKIDQHNITHSTWRKNVE